MQDTAQPQLNQPIPYHVHDGVDSPQIDYNSLLNKPAIVGGYNTVLVGGSAFLARTKLNFAGTGFIGADNSGTLSTDVSLSSNLQAWSGKTAPSGLVVGDSDIQSLTFKTIGSATNTVDATKIWNISISNTPPTSGQYLGYNGTSWIATTVTFPTNTPTPAYARAATPSYSSANITNTACTAAAGGADSTHPFWILWYKSSINLIMAQYSIDANSALPYYTGVTATISVSTTTNQPYITILGSFLYMTCTASNSFKLYRYNASDGTGETLMTISGTAPNNSARYPIFSDGTYLYIFSNSASPDTWYKYSVSGTTATYVSANLYTGLFTTYSGPNLWCDGSSVYGISSNSILKYPLIGGSLISNTTGQLFLGDVDKNTGGFGLSSFSTLFVQLTVDISGANFINYYPITKP